jgi:hypothetical protein
MPVSRFNDKRHAGSENTRYLAPSQVKFGLAKSSTEAAPPAFFFQSSPAPKSKELS